MAGSSDENARTEARMSGTDFKAAINEKVSRAIRAVIPELLGELKKTRESTSEPTREPVGESSTEQPISYKQFKQCDPPRFDGQKDVVLTYKWLREMEAVFKLSKCREDQKVGFAIQSFQAEALYWWDTIEQSMGEDVTSSMRWGVFKELVLEKFCPKGELDRIELKFLQLQAGR